MESTGIHRVPIFCTLEGGLELMSKWQPCNIKSVPGSKIDVKGSERIAVA